MMLESNSIYLLFTKLGILHEPERIAEGIQDDDFLDPASDILDISGFRRANGQQLIEPLLNIRNAPVHRHRAFSRGAHAILGYQAELEASDVEPDVIGLVKIRLDAERFRVPLSRGPEVRGLDVVWGSA